MLVIIEGKYNSNWKWNVSNYGRRTGLHAFLKHHQKKKHLLSKVQLKDLLQV